MPRQRSETRSSGNGSVRRQPGSSRQSSSYALNSHGGSSRNLPAVQKPTKNSVADEKPSTSTSAPAAEGKGRSTGDMFKDMATTAAGVAAGSAVGHAVGAGITGMFSGRGQTAPAQEEEQQKQQPSQQKEESGARNLQQQYRSHQLVEDGPCAFELRQFLKCTEENNDISVCKEFNEAMQQCRRRYNV
ncbi:hypothetical protein KR200_005822 [Drosophila serrata]|nr:hypothetical protein KR200_005822 [Drosophila serrata]